jgi:hypothetical protein
MSHGRYMTGSEQTSEFAPFDESGNIQPVLRKKMVKKSRISMKVTEIGFC